MIFERKINKSRILSQRGISLAEAMIVLAIFCVISIGLYTVLSVGQTTFYHTDASMELQKSLRLTLEKVSKELRESGLDQNGVSKVMIMDQAGFNKTDILRFSIPIMCQTGLSVMDSSGNVAFWGAPLTWGCSDSSCMDADNDCATVDYKFIEYSIDSSSQLIRKVFNNNNSVVREDVFAQGIIGFQTVQNGSKDLVTLTITAQKTSVLKRIITVNAVMNIYLRNRG